MPATSITTTYKNKTFSIVAAASLQELDKLTPLIPIKFTQGGWNPTVTASGGTHDKDAVDISTISLKNSDIHIIIYYMRMLGWCAWYRPFNWNGNSGMAHIHAVPNGWGYLSPNASNQVEDYRNGLNGLANHKPDPHNDINEFRYRSWQDYLGSKIQVIRAWTNDVTQSRLKPTLMSPVKMDLKPFHEVEIIQNNGSWSLTNEGWVPTKRLTAGIRLTYSLFDMEIKLRRGPSLQRSYSAVIQPKTVVIEILKKGNWSLIATLGGNTGYVPTAHLK